MQVANQEKNGNESIVPSAPVRAAPQEGPVLVRLREWFAGGLQGISYRVRQQVAQRSGSLQALAAEIVGRRDRGTSSVCIGVAPPLSLQAAFFMALSSELHYLSGVAVVFQFENNRSVTPLRSTRWCSPRSVRWRMQEFARIAKEGETPGGDSVWVEFIELQVGGSKTVKPIDILLRGKEPTVIEQSPEFTGAFVVELAPLD